MKHRATLLLASLLLVFASLTNAQTVNVGLFQDPPHLDPALATATSEYNVLYQLFDTVLTVDADGNIVPHLAETWTVSEDGLTYTFTLKQGITFHDGTPLDAEAVKYSLERNRTIPDGAFAEQLSVIDSIEVPDAQTVQIKLSQAQGSFLAYMADVSSMVVSPTAAEQGDTQFDANPVGSGPFTFVERVAQDNITLARNESYWDGAPPLAEVVFRFFPDGAIRLANLLSGAVDIIYPVEPRDYISVEDNADIKLLNLPTTGWRIIVLNTRKPPFDDPAVRKALGAAIDKPAIGQVVFNGLEEPADGPIPESSLFYESLTTADAGPEQAQQILADAGASNPSFVLTTIARSPEDQLSQLIQAMATQAGFTAQIEQVEVGEYLRRNTTGDFDAATMQWSGQTDPDGNITSFFTTDGYWNWSGYSNDQVDTLLAQAREITSVEERTELYTQALDLINADAPVVWLTHQQRLVAAKAALDGVTLMANTGVMLLEDATLAP